MFQPKREKVVGGWRRLHNLYISQNVIMLITSMRLKWTESVARMEEMTNAYKIFTGKPEGKIILDWILGNMVGSCGLNAPGSGQEPYRVLVNMVMNFRIP
jgi:hypothetical protein